MVNGKTRLLFTIHCLPFIRFPNDAQRGSPSLLSQPQSPAFLSLPQFGQIPLQFSWQRLRVGTDNRSCSFTISSTSMPSPSKTETDISASVSSATMVEA